MIFGTTSLHTIVKLQKTAYNLDSDTVICGIGSCFSERLLSLLLDCGFSGEQNPTGIIYNTHSIAETVSATVNERGFTKDDFFQYSGLWHSWEHHGHFSDKDLEQAIADANFSLQKFRNELKRAGLVVITPSSSVVYEFKETGRIVANCHKVNNSEFEQRLLSFGQNLENLERMIESIKQFNPSCRIIFTLSPVRHYPGNLLLNSRSKANLLSAIRECCDKHSEICEYFPAYEIMNDELRDYRFYKDDMLHPSELAVKIITGRFVENYFDKSAIIKIQEGIKALQRAVHRPLNKA
jgi:hypothetical protein